MSEDEIFEKGIRGWLRLNSYKEGEWVVISDDGDAMCMAANNTEEIVVIANDINAQVGGFEFQIEAEFSDIDDIQTTEDCIELVEGYLESFNVVMKILRPESGEGIVDLSR
jgi:hypothetical protein